jgi:predicted nucleotidyltransferase
MLKRKRDRIAVEEFCKRIRNNLGREVRAIKLFGSKVTDRDNPESDIDLFIVVSEKTAEVENLILDTAFDLDLKYNVYISTRIVSESVLKDPVWRITPFIKKIEQEGVLV